MEEREGGMEYAEQTQTVNSLPAPRLPPSPVMRLVYFLC